MAETAIVDVVVEGGDWDEAALTGLAERAVSAVLRRLRVAGGEVAILACDDDRIAVLNADFRGRARPTNVLSWPSAERGATDPGGVPAPPGDAELGDIALAWETCVAEAAAEDIAVDDHVLHLIVHGVLHLLGYDHETDADAVLMEGLEVEILADLGLSDPYSRKGAPASAL